MQMIDVLTKLREIAARSPEEIGRAIAAAEKMSGQPVTEEMTEKQKKFFGGGKKDDDKTGEKKTESKKPDADGDGVPDWADKKPGKDDNEDKKKVDEDISITLSGSDAVLAEILKLAGQIGAKTTKGPEPMGGLGGGDMGGPITPPPAPIAPKPMGMPSSGPIPSLSSMVGDEPGMDMGMDGPGMDMDVDMGSDDMGMDDEVLGDSYDATTTPNPTVMGMNAAVPAGNDLAKPKMTAPRVSPGDNPFHRAVSFD